MEPENYLSRVTSYTLPFKNLYFMYVILLTAKILSMSELILLLLYIKNVAYMYSIFESLLCELCCIYCLYSINA